jgi:hypothetical protein
MQRLLAISWLTWKAALRFRLFVVIAVLLVASVVALPLLLKDDGTARGFTQILLTYTLSVIASLLGLSTLWLACGTLARDIDDCQIQVVATKPVARWQIWLGKWLGIVTLNAALLALTGACVYALLQWRATKLPEREQFILKNEVLVARAAAKPVSLDADVEAETERRYQERIKNEFISEPDKPILKNQIREELKSDIQLAPAEGGILPWQIDLGLAKSSLRDKPLYLRVRFNSAQKSPSGTFLTRWQVGEPQTGRIWGDELSLSPDTFHEIELPPNLYNDDGILTVIVQNLTEISLVFPTNEGMEVLYRESGFALNFVRGLSIILCWMALLAALGLASASFLSFPVAAFFSLAILAMTLSTSTLATVVEDGTLMGVNSETGERGAAAIDFIAVPAFKAALTVINLAKDFSPVASLSTGRSITWTELGRAFTQIVLVFGGFIALIGISIFNRRELATAQSNQ